VRLHHVALRVTDAERSTAFYRALGLRELRRLEDGGRLRSVWLRAGEAVLMLETTLRGRGAESGSGHLLAFGVEDLVACEEALRRAGIPVEDRTAATLYVRDPDGHRVGLSVFRFEDSDRAG
jgi:catechol 2,3-dioxygenase-like lactoylglutathione lyase family enzyme